jgi:hypothetical protein
MWLTFKEKQPKEKTWIKTFSPSIGNKKGEFVGTTGWEYFVGMNDNLALFSDNEEMEYVFPAGEEGITHWK